MNGRPCGAGSTLTARTRGQPARLHKVRVMPTEKELIATKFQALAAEFNDASQTWTAKPHHMAVRADRITERAGKAVLQLDSSFDDQIVPGSEGDKWLRHRRSCWDKPEESGYAGKKDLAIQTFFELVRYFTLGGRSEFNKGDFDLLTGFTAASEIIPWPDWWNEKSADEKLEYDELLELQLRGELPGRVPCKGHDVRRLKPKPVPNPYADGDSPDKSDSFALLRDQLSLYARSCELVADLIVQKRGSSAITSEGERLALGPASSDEEEWRTLGWFPSTMRSRIRKAAHPQRKTKRVATTTFDGVKFYSGRDARRYWGRDLDK